MSIRIALDSQPEFYTNLDQITGKIIVNLSRTEQVGSIVVKLEGESITALQVPRNYGYDANTQGRPPPGPPGSTLMENHKILYKVQQVFPDEYYTSSSNPYGAFPLQVGQHEFPFKFKLPINNACSDHVAMSKIGGMAGVGGYGSGGGLFGIGGVRVMDGTKQLYLRHKTATLPPSLTGFPTEAEIRYYIKVTVQRPGFLKENWRVATGFKFLPIEPPRPEITGQEMFARRPFTFKTGLSQPKKRNSFFSSIKGEKASGSAETPKEGEDAEENINVPPSVEVSARLPHPAVLTCNRPVPLRLVVKKLVKSSEQVYLNSLQISLIGTTEVRSHGMANRKMNKWDVVSKSELSIPLCAPEDGVGVESTIPDDLWKQIALPNTVAPSFATCNLSRKYSLEITVGACAGKPKKSLSSQDPFGQQQTIILPLHFSEVQVFSGITPPPELLRAARTTKPGRATLSIPPPRLPPRNSHSAPATPVTSSHTQTDQPAIPPRPPVDPLYPPQLLPGQDVPPYDDAPPSYDEAMAENLSGPFDGLRPRPAYSGVTNENAPSQMPEKS